MYELGTSYETYKGYTVILKGFIYKDAEIEKEADFALVRLSMWCCALICRLSAVWLTAAGVWILRRMTGSL